MKSEMKFPGKNTSGVFARSCFKRARTLFAFALIAGSLGLWNCGVSPLSGSDKNDQGNLFLLVGLALPSGACPSYNWNLPANVPPPPVPSGNCQTQAKVELGRFLFYDKRLSGDVSLSCASCHRQELAFTDGLARPQGILGETHPRNTQQLSNAGYHGRLGWANNLLSNLELQAAVPILSETGPGSITELGFQDQHLERFRTDAAYPALFQRAFGVSPGELSLDHVQRALSSFQRTLLSFESGFDRYMRGEETLSPEAIRGAELFNGEKTECFHCHGGFNFADSSFHATAPQERVLYHNNGLYAQDDYAAFAVGERGLYDVTLKVADEGRFRAPSLRNLGYSFPYMHDGSIACDPALAGDRLACARNALGKVLDHYMSGGKQDSLGNVHPTVDGTLIRPFTLTAQERSDMIEFLLSLDDANFTTNPAYSNPRPGDPNFGP